MSKLVTKVLSLSDSVGKIAPLFQIVVGERDPSQGIRNSQFGFKRARRVDHGERSALRSRLQHLGKYQTYAHFQAGELRDAVADCTRHWTAVGISVGRWAMADTDQVQGDEVLRRMLATPPGKHKPLGAKRGKAAAGKSHVKDSHGRYS